MQRQNPWRLPKHASSFFFFSFLFLGGGGGGGGGEGSGGGIAIFWPIPDLQVRTFGKFVASEGTLFSVPNCWETTILNNGKEKCG